METLDKHFRELTKAAFARYGFAHGELIGRWPEIAGPELAQYCEPERIKWPRGSGETAQKMAGTLVIRAAPGRALDIQHEAPRIIERVNRYYGYGAVNQVRVNQGTISGTQTPVRRHPEPPPAAPLGGIADGALQSALERLGANVVAARSGSPQGKE